jgi:hypothetical protein
MLVGYMASRRGSVTCRSSRTCSLSIWRSGCQRVPFASVGKLGDGFGQASRPRTLPARILSSDGSIQVRRSAGVQDHGQDDLQILPALFFRHHCGNLVKVLEHFQPAFGANTVTAPFCATLIGPAIPARIHCPGATLPSSSKRNEAGRTWGDFSSMPMLIRGASVMQLPQRTPRARGKEAMRPAASRLGGASV